MPKTKKSPTKTNNINSVQAQLKAGINEYDKKNNIVQMQKILDFVKQNHSNEVFQQTLRIAIHAAVQQSKPELITLLVNNEADIDAVADNGKTPLLYAAEHIGNMVKPLIEHGADITKVDAMGRNALFIASSKGHIAIMARLVCSIIDKDLDLYKIINQTDSNGNSVMTIAKKEKDMTLLGFLVLCGVKITADEWQQVNAWANSGAASKFFWRQNILEFSQDGNAARHNYMHRDLLEQIIQNAENKGVDINKSTTKNYTKTKVWAAARQPENIQELRELVKQPGVFLDKGNNNGIAPIHAAAISGNHQGIEVLAMGYNDNKADVNKQVPTKENNERNRGKTAAHFAAENNNIKVISTLLQYGANFTLKDARGQTPIEIARSKGYSDIVQTIHDAIYVRSNVQQQAPVNPKSRPYCSVSAPSSPLVRFKSEELSSPLCKCISASVTPGF
jgi:ankyrin repeat protein